MGLKFLNKKFYSFFRTALITSILLICALTILSFMHYSNSDNNRQLSFPDDYKIVSPPLPEKIDFCGEAVPLYNSEVLERLDREIIINTYWHSSTILAIKRANKWFPVIEPILVQNGIPEDFKYLAITESNLTNVISPKDAVGFWQFLEDTAIKYGLEVNSEVDERYHVEKSTKAACDYLKEAFEKFGAWTLAAAAYNFGISGIENQLKRQKATSYYNLVFGEETSRYLFRIVAFKHIFNDPEKYGFFIDSEKLYEPVETTTLEINYSLNDLADFAHLHGINYKILKTHNPWLRENYLTNRTGKTYEIKFPGN